MPAPDVMMMFAVPFGFARVPTHAQLNPALKRFIFQLEKSGTAANPRPLTPRNAAVFESHFNLFRESDPAVQELKAFCWNQLLGLIGRLNGYDLPTVQRLQIYSDSWVHVTRRGGYFGLHNHPNASWSGVYCVDPGESDSDKKDSGVLSFVNPMIASAMHIDAGVARMPLPYGYQVASMRLEPGQLVIFPSWVLHDVRAFEGNGERITISFNCWFSLADPAAASGP
ncbi:MAG: putative 2OG-Fe(II) oxygenase [Steroidobacteraceae bacterium]